MADRWPPLDQYEVGDIPSLARKLLHTLPGGDFRSHLEARRVGKIELGFFLFGAVLLMLPGETGFGIGLSCYHENSVKDWMLRIGHELGHTFAYGIKPDVPIRRESTWGGDMPHKYDEREEELCDLFATEWVNCWKHDELRSLLRMYERTPRKDVLNSRNRLRRTIYLSGNY